jgi:hypothetical protein
LINQPLNVARDLWQAPQAEHPCAAFATALDTIKAAPEPFYVTPVQKAKLPEPLPGDAADAAVCSTLPSRLELLQKDLVARFPASDAGALETAEHGHAGGSGTEAGTPTGPTPQPTPTPKKAPAKKKKKKAPPKKKNFFEKMGDEFKK